MFDKLKPMAGDSIGCRGALYAPMFVCFSKLITKIHPTHEDPTPREGDGCDSQFTEEEAHLFATDQ